MKVNRNKIHNIFSNLQNEKGSSTSSYHNIVNSVICLFLQHSVYTFYKFSVYSVCVLYMHYYMR